MSCASVSSPPSASRAIRPRSAGRPSVARSTSEPRVVVPLSMPNQRRASSGPILTARLRLHNSGPAPCSVDGRPKSALACAEPSSPGSRGTRAACRSSTQLSCSADAAQCLRQNEGPKHGRTPGRCNVRREQSASIVRVAAVGLVAVRHERERLSVVRRQLGRRHHCDHKQEYPTNQYCPVAISSWCSPGGARSGGAGHGLVWRGVAGAGSSHASDTNQSTYAAPVEAEYAA